MYTCENTLSAGEAEEQRRRGAEEWGREMHTSVQLIYIASSTFRMGGRRRGGGTEDDM